MSFIIDRIRNWRRRLSIPENQRGEKRWRFAPNGIDKIPLVDQDEVDKFNLARTRLEEWKAERRRTD